MLHQHKLCDSLSTNTKRIMCSRPGEILLVGNIQKHPIKQQKTREVLSRVFCLVSLPLSSLRLALKISFFRTPLLLNVHYLKNKNSVSAQFPLKTVPPVTMYQAAPTARCLQVKNIPLNFIPIIRCIKKPLIVSAIY